MVRMRNFIILLVILLLGKSGWAQQFNLIYGKPRIKDVIDSTHGVSAIPTRCDIVRIDHVGSFEDSYFIPLVLTTKRIDKIDSADFDNVVLSDDQMKSLKNFILNNRTLAEIPEVKPFGFVRITFRFEGNYEAYYVPDAAASRKYFTALRNLEAIGNNKNFMFEIERIIRHFSR
jgi:hypothetical protein